MATGDDTYQRLYRLTGFMPESLTRAPGAPDTTINRFLPEVKTRAAEPAKRSGGLWDKVAKFFDPEDDDDLSGDDLNDRLSQAGWAGASQAIAQSAADYRKSPIQILTDAIAGYNIARQGARGELRKEQREDRLFGLKERELQLELEKAERDRNKLDPFGSAEGGYYALTPEGGLKQLVPGRPAKLDPFGSAESGYFVLDEKGQPRQVVAGRGAKPDPFGTAEGGYYVLDETGRPRQIVPGIGRDPGTTYTTLSPAESQALGYPPGVIVQRSSKGELSEFSPPGSDRQSDLAVLQSERDQYPPGSPKFDEVQRRIDVLLGKTGSLGSEGERNRKRLLDLNAEVQQAGGWQGVDPAAVAEYERIYREAAQPKFDVASGTTITPDLSDLLLPPSLMQGGAAPAAPVTLPGGGPPPDVPLLGQEPGAGAPPGAAGMTGAAIAPPTAAPAPAAPQPAPAPLQYAPAGGRAQGATRTQIEDYTKAQKGLGTLRTATRRIREILDQTGDYGALSGPLADQLAIATNQVVTALGQQSDAGTMQPSDIERYKGEILDLTSPVGWTKNALGLRTLRGSIDALESLAQDGLLSRARDAGQETVQVQVGGQMQTVPIFRTEEEADKKYEALPKGGVFVDPYGVLRQK